MKGLQLLGISAAMSALLIFAASQADAQRGGRGGGGGGGRGGQQVRSSSSGSIGGAANRSASANRNVNRNTNVNRSGNRVNTGNINTGDVNINVDRDYDGWGGYHPVARGAAVAATTAVVMGAYYSSLPSNCVTVVRVGVTYYQCGSYWYQPSYSGSNVQYVVVAEP